MRLARTEQVQVQEQTLVMVIQVDHFNIFRQIQRFQVLLVLSHLAVAVAHDFQAFTQGWPITSNGLNNMFG